MTGIRLLDLPDLGAVTDASEIVGAKGGSGHFTGAALKAYVGAGGGGSGAEASDATPVMDGTAAAGTATAYARGDHVHPTPNNLTLTTLSDVTVSSPSSGQVLRHNGTEWVNGAVQVADIAATGALTNENFLRADGLWTTPPAGDGGATAFSGLSDVTLTSPASGQVARFDGTKWVNGAVGVDDIDATGTPSGSTYLTGAGTWAAPAIPAASSTAPVMDGTAAIGSSSAYARANHVHPTDTSRAAASAIPAASSTTPAANGTAAVGVATSYARADHVHPQYIPTFPVEKYGAVGNGTTDDTSAIQAAINAAALVGGDVLFGAKTYKISSTLYVGNGSTSAISTYGNVRLIGDGIPPMPPQFLTGLDAMNRKATYLKWSGSTGGIMVQIRGPLQGWGVSNIFFDGENGGTDFAGVAGYGLYVVSAQFGDCENLSFRGCRIASIYSSTVAPPSGVTVSDSLSNTWTNINIGMGWVTGVKGIVLTGVSPAGSNTDYNNFNNVTISMPTTSSIVAYGIYFASCDSNTFNNVHLMNGHSNCIGAVFDYAINPDWPAGNQINGIDWGGLAGPVQTAGTPSATARPNYIYAVNECNGGFMPTDVKNVVTTPGIMATHDEVGLTAAKTTTALWTPFRAGLYRVSYYLLVTGGNAGGGTITPSFAWLDGSGTQTVTTAAVTNSPGNYVQGSVVMRVGASTNVNWAAAFSGINGTTVTTQYSVALSAERMF